MPTDNINMGGTSVYTSTAGIKFQDGTLQTTAATPAGPTLNVTNGNPSSFYLPLLPNQTSPFSVLILDAPNGYLSMQADAGGGSNIGGNLLLLAPSFTANPQHAFSLTSGINDNIQGGSVIHGIEVSASSGPLILRTGSSQDVQITHGSGANGVKLDNNDNTLKPIGTGHLLSDMMQQGTPASSSALGIQGQVMWDSSFIYVCVATNTWMRAALSTF